MTNECTLSAQQFEQVAREQIAREGLDNVLAFLGAHDFYTAPASTRFHNAREGGLVAHSLNVYNCLLKLNEAFHLELKPESMAIAALFHDVCKVDTYKPATRNRKNEQGKWETVPTWEFDEAMPLGHGEKSVIMLQGMGLKLTAGEMYAIRWHMGGFDNAVKGGERGLSAAFERCPLAVALHMADIAATYLCEGREGA